MNLPASFLTSPIEKVQETIAIRVISYDCLSPIAPTQNMINSSRIFDPQRSRHVKECDNVDTLCQYLALIPFPQLCMSERSVS